MMMKLTAGIRGSIVDMAASAAEKIPGIGKKIADQIRKMKPEDDVVASADKAKNEAMKSSHTPSGSTGGGIQNLPKEINGHKNVIGKSLDGLEPGYKARILAMGQEYSALTGKPMQINSAFRNPEKQAKLRKAFEEGRGNSAAKWSIHSTGHAVDIPSKQTSVIRSKGLDSKRNNFV